MKRLSFNLGHVTNSSSMVYWFPREILEDPEISAFLEAYDLGKGWVGGDLFSRSGNHSFIVTREQRLEAIAQFEAAVDDDWTPTFPTIDPDDDAVIVIYGDEYSTTAHQVGRMLVDACKRHDLPYRDVDMH